MLFLKKRLKQHCKNLCFGPTLCPKMYKLRGCWRKTIKKHCNKNCWSVFNIFKRTEPKNWRCGRHPTRSGVNIIKKSTSQKNYSLSWVSVNHWNFIWAICRWDFSANLWKLSDLRRPRTDALGKSFRSATSCSHSRWRFRSERRNRHQWLNKK